MEKSRRLPRNRSQPWKLAVALLVGIGLVGGLAPAAAAQTADVTVDECVGNDPGSAGGVCVNVGVSVDLVRQSTEVLLVETNPADWETTTVPVEVCSIPEQPCIGVEVPVVAPESLTDSITVNLLQPDVDPSQPVVDPFLTPGNVCEDAPNRPCELPDNLQNLVCNQGVCTPRQAIQNLCEGLSCPAIPAEAGDDGGLLSVALADADRDDRVDGLAYELGGQWVYADI